MLRGFSLWPHLQGTPLIESLPVPTGRWCEPMMVRQVYIIENIIRIFLVYQQLKLSLSTLQKLPARAVFFHISNLGVVINWERRDGLGFFLIK